MGEKFRDFPCFYYLNDRVNKKSRIQFYCMLAAMFGQTPEQAAQNSELFAHASGKLFGGTGYTLDEIKKEAGNYFEKPYKDCRGFYRRKAYDEAGLKDNCCVICPYSSVYSNACLNQERQILRIFTEQRDLLGLTDCSTSDFKSKLAVSCSNELSSAYPIIPFNAYLFEYLIRNDELSAESVTTFVNHAMIENELFVSKEILSSFVETQVEIVSHIALPGGDRTSALLYALNSLRELRYSPPQLVHPASRSKKKNSKKEQLAASAQEGLVRLLSDIHNIRFIETGCEENLQDTEDTKNICSNNRRVGTIESVDDEVPSLFSITTVTPPLTDKVIMLANEINKKPCPNNMDKLDLLNVTAKNINDNTECDDSKDGISLVTITPLPENTIYPISSENDITDKCNERLDNESLTSIENTDNINKQESISGSACCVCHGILPEKYPYHEDWVRGLYCHCMACENAFAKGDDKPFFSSALTHPVVAAGCAFSNDKPEEGCIYNDMPLTLSDEFIPIISDCSDYTCELSNLVSFVEACENSSSASIECVRMYGIDGLLFYVAGSYYFIAGGTTACSAMKKLFSNASKLELYSMNPLLVHVKLLRFGLRHVKIESLSVRYSVFVGTDLLLPPSVMFVTGDGTDMYRTIMPQYARLYERTILSAEEAKRYEKLKRLEWALATSVDTSFIALGTNRSVYGSNALNYRFSLLDFEKICREGTLYVVTLDKDSQIPPKEEIQLWEDVAGRLASSSLSCMNYSFILGLGKGISYFTCFEEEAFFDSLMASARSTYKKAYKKEVHLQVTQEKYVTYNS